MVVTPMKAQRSAMTIWSAAGYADWFWTDSASSLVCFDYGWSCLCRLDKCYRQQIFDYNKNEIGTPFRESYLIVWTILQQPHTSCSCTVNLAPSHWYHSSAMLQTCNIAPMNPVLVLSGNVAIQKLPQTHPDNPERFAYPKSLHVLRPLFKKNFPDSMQSFCHRVIADIHQPHIIFQADAPE